MKFFFRNPEAPEQVAIPTAPTVEDHSQLAQHKAGVTQTIHREFILDSGSTFHLIQEQDISESERASIKDLDEPIPLQSANGFVVTHQAAKIFMKELSVYLDCYVLTDSPNAISLDLLCDQHG